MKMSKLFLYASFGFTGLAVGSFFFQPIFAAGSAVASGLFAIAAALCD